jgi:hypothetical protein
MDPQEDINMTTIVDVASSKSLVSQKKKFKIVVVA